MRQRGTLVGGVVVRKSSILAWAILVAALLSWPIAKATEVETDTSLNSAAFNPGWYDWTIPWPAGRMGYIAGSDEIRGRLILWGGLEFASTPPYDGRMHNDLWFYYPPESRWERVPMSGDAPPEAVVDSFSIMTVPHIVGAYAAPRNALYIAAVDALYRADLTTRTFTKGQSIALLWTAATYDSRADRLLLLDTSSGSVQSLNLDSLTVEDMPQVGAFPSDRSEASMVFDPVGNRVLVFGGGNPPAWSNDLWALQLDQAPAHWVQLFPTGMLPPARGGHAAVYLPGLHTMVIHGGHSGYSTDLYSDTWVLDLNTFTWTQNAAMGPAGRFAHQLFAWGDQFWTFGGNFWNNCCAEGVYDDLWSLDLQHGGWTEPLIRKPGRWADAFVLDAKRDAIFTFGGSTPTGQATDGNYAFGLGSRRWQELAAAGQSPSAREGAAAIRDEQADRVYLFGGRGSVGDVDNNLYRLDPQAMQWQVILTAGLRPVPRVGHSAVFDAVTNEIIIFGGETNGVQLNDVWRFDLSQSAWHQDAVSGTLPPARNSQAMILDAPRHRLIVFGGDDDLGARGDLWAYNLDNQAWEALVPAGTPPPPARLGRMVYDPARDCAYCFGGQYSTDTYFNDLYVLDLGSTPVSWSRVTLDQKPPGRYGEVLTLDSSRDCLFMLDGFGAGGYYQDIWRLALAVPQYTVTLAADPAQGGIVTGGGLYNSGLSITVTATPAAGYAFTAWTENGNLVSPATDYDFIVSNNRALTAHFSAIAFHTWFRDADGDGYGNQNDSLQSADHPMGYAADSSDCNDDDATIHPGATDTPDDGIDQDCDGLDMVTPPAANPDADGDGVPDSNDQCPETPIGTAVDGNGCPIVDQIRLGTDSEEPSTNNAEPPPSDGNDPGIAQSETAEQTTPPICGWGFLPAMLTSVLLLMLSMVERQRRARGKRPRATQ